MTYNKLSASLVCISLILVSCSKSLPAASEAELSKAASADAYDAWQKDDVASMTKLATSMKNLACFRHDEPVCSNLKSFESAKVPTLHQGKNILLGKTAIGTTDVKNAYTACLLENGNPKITGTCFTFSAESEVEQQAVTAILAQQKAGEIDEQNSVFKFLQAQFDKLPLGDITLSGSDMIVPQDPEDKTGNPPILLRQKGNNFYLAELTHVPLRPNDFDSYPTLLSSALSYLK